MLQRSLNEVHEERVWLEGTRAIFWMELNANKPRMRGDFDGLHEIECLIHSGRTQTSLREAVAKLIVEFVAMAMAF